MNRLYDDMISTADSFVVNFSDRGTFDYSFDSLTLAEELLDEMADYMFEDDEAVYNASTMIGAYVFETVAEIWAANTYGSRRKSSRIS